MKKPSDIFDLAVQSWSVLDTQNHSSVLIGHFLSKVLNMSSHISRRPSENDIFGNQLV